jgi:hypothetical protein
MSRLPAVPRPTPLKVSLTPLSRRLQAQVTEIAALSSAKGRALEQWNQLILDALHAKGARHATGCTRRHA